MSRFPHRFALSQTFAPLRTAGPHILSNTRGHATCLRHSLPPMSDPVTHVCALYLLAPLRSSAFRRCRDILRASLSSGCSFPTTFGNPFAPLSKIYLKTFLLFILYGL